MTPMQEFIDYQAECQTLYNAYTSCGATCSLGQYCVSHGCNMSVCNTCLTQIQWAVHPLFTYSCQKITYHYVLRFLNRFASEIAYAMWNYKFGNIQKYNVVSLGCGPGSEIYGLIKALRKRNPNIVLDYQGYDTNKIWKDVQSISKSKLSNTGHHIVFHDKDMFTDYIDFHDKKVDLLVLNYILSDAQKFNDKSHIDSFLADLAWFIISNDVRNILFNDNNYYGTDGGYDSGVQLMLRLIEKLKSWGVSLTDQYRRFPFDPKRGNQRWLAYNSWKLAFPLLPNNKLDKNVRNCWSKQILIHLNK